MLPVPGAIGAALLEHLAGDRFTADSAGLSPADEVNPAVAATVAELGMDITDRVPREVTAVDLEAAEVFGADEARPDTACDAARRGLGVVVPEPGGVGFRGGAPATRSRIDQD